jgi:hypothetical protein
MVVKMIKMIDDAAYLGMFARNNVLPNIKA